MVVCEREMLTYDKEEKEEKEEKVKMFDQLLVGGSSTLSTLGEVKFRVLGISRYSIKSNGAIQAMPFCMIIKVPISLPLATTFSPFTYSSQTT